MTFDWVLKNKKSYCIFTLNQKSNSSEFINFQNYIKKNSDKLYDNKKKLELKNYCGINCATLVKKYMMYDINVIDIIKKNIELIDTNIKKIKKNNDIEPSVFGQFIDYLIRFKIG